jgi:OOP family OmpA-OmpF porin
MTRLSAPFLLILLLSMALIGCEKREEIVKQPDIPATPAALSAPPSPTPPPGAIGFDVSQAPVVNPQLGSFPYVGLLKGYQKTDDTPNKNKDVAFDRYEFFDGVKIIPVEGRLVTIEADGEGASAFEIVKTYESLITSQGGVKAFAGNFKPYNNNQRESLETRHRDPIFGDDEMGLSVLRMPDKEIWVEAYVSSYSFNKNKYFLTVVEKKTFEARASLLPAEEMKRELDAKGHVALYINFDFDKADIKQESQPIIEEIVKLLQNNPTLNLTIEGHTDNIGAPDYNRRLSDARANSVVAALGRRGIETRRLKAVGYGPDKPIADNSAEDGRAKNRRVELLKMP